MITEVVSALKGILTGFLIIQLIFGALAFVAVLYLKNKLNEKDIENNKKFIKKDDVPIQECFNHFMTNEMHAEKDKNIELKMNQILEGVNENKKLYYVTIKKGLVDNV